MSGMPPNTVPMTFLAAMAPVSAAASSQMSTIQETFLMPTKHAEHQLSDLCEILFGNFAFSRFTFR